MEENATHGVEVEMSRLKIAEDFGLEMGSDEMKNLVVEYDDKLTIKNYSTSFNLIDSNDKPDYRNVTYKSPTEHLNCPICQQPFINPFTTICGHTFCKECILECFKMSKENIRQTHENESHNLKGCCPLDRTPLDSTNVNDLFPTPLIISNLIDDLRVICLNYERGCEWTGCRWEIDRHVVSECGFTGVRCGGIRNNAVTTNETTDDTGLEEKEDSCRMVVERRFLVSQDDKSIEEKTNNECIHKLYQCQFCSAKVTKISEKDHLNHQCLFNYRTCDLCSNDMILQKNMDKHKENCLKTGKITCPAESIGCQWVGNNDTALEIHLQSNKCQLYQILPHWNEMNEKINSLTTETSFLQKQINKILDSTIQGKITNLGYSEPIEEINRFTTDWNDDIRSSSLNDKYLHINYELERLKNELDERVVPFIDRENSSLNDRQNILNGLVNDNFMMKDELNLQRVLINSLRKQVQFLLFKNKNGFGFINSPGGGFASGTMNTEIGLATGALDDPSEIVDIPSRSNSEERLNLKL